MTRVCTLCAGHPVAEVFLIGWSFVYLLEGTSGFGTPVALAAPMLVSLGHPPIPSIVCCLVTNTMATVCAYPTAAAVQVWCPNKFLPR